MGIGVGLADLCERQRRHPQQGGIYQAASGGWGEAEFGEGEKESYSCGVRGHYRAVGNGLVQLALWKRKYATSNDYLPLIKTKEEGRRMLIAAVIATAVWDALGQGMTGQNRERLIDSAWRYLESSAFRHDLDVVGFFVDVDVFLDELKELNGA